MWLSDVFRWDIASSVVVSQLSTSNLFDPGEANQYGVWSKLVPFSNRLSLKNITDSWKCIQWESKYIH